ncbi:MAG: flagellar basal body P-ring formation chaperone FlgA [Neomegalonema sp.]|nr:flagellar basal body P-ring formation chaperone FlgA [Neomegalonema sp.]
MTYAAPYPAICAGYRPPAGLIAAGALASLMFAAAPMGDAEADVLMATDHIPAGVVIEPGHVALRPGRAKPGELEAAKDAVGLAARSSLYKGRPIRADQLGPPIIVKRNGLVTLQFRRGGLILRTEGRALDQGGVGERIRVMNLDTKRTIFGVILSGRVVEVK